MKKPHSEESEKCLLGSILMNFKSYYEISGKITGKDFNNKAHEIIFNTIEKMIYESIPLDLALLAEYLNKTGSLEIVGGAYYLSELLNNTPTSAKIEIYCYIIKEFSIKRELINVAEKTLKENYDGKTDVFDNMAQLQNQIHNITNSIVSNIHNTPKELSEIVWNELKAVIRGERVYLKSSIKRINNIIGGYYEGEFTIIAARPSIGKTAFGLQEAMDMSIIQQKPVAFMSIEMNKLQIMNRAIAQQLRINLKKIRAGNLIKDEVDKIEVFLKQHSERRLIIEDPPGLNTAGFVARATYLKERYDVVAIFIDYIQLIRSINSRSDEYATISETSAILKETAKRLNIPIIGLCQLNRKTEDRKYKTPALSDLRGSGNIEQDADVVIMIDRPEQYGIKEFQDKTNSVGFADLIIAKQRNGEIGTVRVKYTGIYTSFENIEDVYFGKLPGNHIKDDDPF